MNLILTVFFFLIIYKLLQLQLRIPAENDQLSYCRRIHNILNFLRTISPTYQELYIIKEGDQSEMVFCSMLIEDRWNNSMSLDDFMKHVHSGGAL